MIHQYQLGGYNIVLDVCSGAVHAVDELAYDMIGLYETLPREEVLAAMAAKYPETPAGELAETEPSPAAEPAEEPAENPAEPAAETPAEAPAEEPAAAPQETPAEEPAKSAISDPALYAENLERALEYAKTIHDTYWDSKTCLSKLTPAGGTPHLWPYTEQVGMVNGILAAIGEDHPDREFYLTYLDELITGLRHYRVKSARLSGNQSWNNPNYVMAKFGENDGTPNSYAIYSSSRTDHRVDANVIKADAVYFDDDVWVAKEFYFAYVNTGNIAYLNEAANIVNFILGEGFETTEGLNGVYWKWSSKFEFAGGNYSDSNHASLNTCSTASCAMVAAMLCSVLPGTPLEGLRELYLDRAEKIFNFCTEVMVDKSTKCLYDKVFLREGFQTQTSRSKQILKTDTNQYAYNTGTYLTLGADLYALLSASRPDDAQAILDAALASAKGANQKFGSKTVVKGEYSYPSHSWFTSFLVSGFGDLVPYGEKCAEYLDHMRTSLDYGWKNNRSADGLMSPAWVKGWKEFNNNEPNSESNPRQILYQSANAHCFAMLAEYYR